MKRIHAILILAGTLVAGTASCSNGQGAPVSGSSSRVAALFEPLSEGIQPGAAVLAVKDGEVIFEGGFGYADLKSKAPITTSSSFRLASVSKQFTTAAIIALENDGKLAYDDPLVMHVPEFDSWPGVTIRHLMTHTSGIPDYYELDYYADYPSDGPMPQNADLVEILSRYPEPDFAPGDKYVYNNAAYEVLVTIVERASGMDFTSFLKTRVFEPAGMKTATTFNSSRPNIPGRVIGYRPTIFSYRVLDYDPFNDMLGAGGVYATLQDFEAWANALAAGGSFPVEAFEPATLNDGTVTDYGFGWVIDDYRGHARRAHSGSWVGFRTGIARYPDEDLTIVVLTNRSDADTDEFIDKVSDVFLPTNNE